MAKHIEGKHKDVIYEPLLHVLLTLPLPSHATWLFHYLHVNSNTDLYTDEIHLQLVQQVPDTP